MRSTITHVRPTRCQRMCFVSNSRPPPPLQIVHPAAPCLNRPFAHVIAIETSADDSQLVIGYTTETSLVGATALSLSLVRVDLTVLRSGGLFATRFLDWTKELAKDAPNLFSWLCDDGSTWWLQEF